MAIASGTRRRKTVGLSSRSWWGSTSTYKSDLVASLPQRPSNAGAYLLIFLGVCGLLFALLVGSNSSDAGGFIVFVVVVSVLLLLAGYAAKRSPQALAYEQDAWDQSWMCARCGHQWKGADGAQP
jgi:hypothetical protein